MLTSSRLEIGKVGFFNPMNLNENMACYSISVSDLRRKVDQ